MAEWKRLVCCFVKICSTTVIELQNKFAYLDSVLIKDRWKKICEMQGFSSSKIRTFKKKIARHCSRHPPIVFITTLRYYSMRYRKVAMNIFHVIRLVGCAKNWTSRNNERPTPSAISPSRRGSNELILSFLTLLMRFPLWR